MNIFGGSMKGMTAAKWYELGSEDGGTVGGTDYSQKECYQKALECNEEYSHAWMGLAHHGGGYVRGSAYSALQCYQKAFEPGEAVWEATLQKKKMTEPTESVGVGRLFQTVPDLTASMNPAAFRKAKTPKAKTFPQQLGPFSMAATQAFAGKLEIESTDPHSGVKTFLLRRDGNFWLGSKGLTKLRDCIASWPVKGKMNPLQPLASLPEDQVKKMGAPFKGHTLLANSFTWSVPVPIEFHPGTDRAVLDVADEGTPEVGFLLRGGFVFCNRRGDIIGVCTISPAASGQGMQFGSPIPWRREWTEALQDRYSRITIQALRNKGACHYCWVRPDESGVIECDDKPNLQYGGFCYLFHEEIVPSEEDEYAGDIVFPLDKVDASNVGGEGQGFKFVKEGIKNQVSGGKVFPDQLGPFSLKKTMALSGKLEIESTEPSGVRTFALSRESKFWLATNQLKQLKGCISSWPVRGKVNPLQPLASLQDQVKHMGAPLSATSFTWSVPVPIGFFPGKEQEIADLAVSGSAEVAFVLRGGFVFCDGTGAISSACTISPGAEGEGMQFGPPIPWRQEWTYALQNRYSRITIQALKDKGARYYCWVRPDEPNFSQCDGDPGLQYGGFCYLFHEEILPPGYDAYAKDIVFPLVKVDPKNEKRQSQAFKFVNAAISNQVKNIKKGRHRVGL